MFGAKRKLQFFEPGCSSESLSSGEALRLWIPGVSPEGWRFQGAFGLVIVICYINAKAKDDCLLHGLRMVQPLRFYP